MIIGRSTCETRCHDISAIVVKAPPCALVVDVGLVFVREADHRYVTGYVGYAIELREHRESLVFESDCSIVCILRSTSVSDRSGVVVVNYTIAVEIDNIIVTWQFLTII